MKKRDLQVAAESVVKAYDKARERGQDIKPVGVRVAIQYLRATLNPSKGDSASDG